MPDVVTSLNPALEGRYHIERQLGEGGMATVYLAHDVKHGRQVAVKVLRPDVAFGIGADRFVREIRIAARLSHPHILPLFDSGEAGGFLWFVMPVVEGKSLRERMQSAKQIPLEEARQIAMELADALDYAHRHDVVHHDVVHRDVKPENIMLHEGHAVVTDFGIGKAVTAAAEGSRALTQTGVTVGTPAYMAPEQVAGDEDIDGTSDLYALGCVCYEMLTGEQPFTGATAQAPAEGIECDRASLLPAIFRVIALSRLGRIEEALEVATHGVLAFGRNPWALAVLALVHARAGDAARAGVVCDELGARAAHEYVPTLYRATALAAAGRMDEAFSVLEEGCRERDPTVWTVRLLEPDLFWDDPRFAEACRCVGIEPLGR